MNSFIGWVEILAVVKEYKLGNTIVRIHDYFYYNCKYIFSKILKYFLTSQKN